MELPEPFFSDSNFAKITKIGEGGNGCCFLLYDKRKKEFKVLKVAKNDASLHKEGEIMTKISIPLLSKVYNYSNKEDVDSWILMDYIPGIPLSEVIPSDDDLEMDHVKFFKIAAVLCNTIKKLHKAKKIHRDVKPENVVIDGDFNAHLIDFGEAGGAGADGKRKTDKIHGTIPYTAPEAFVLKPSLKSDIFSIGATMFQMVTKQFPFKDLYFTLEGVNRCREIVENNQKFSADQEVLTEHFDDLEEYVISFEEADDYDEQCELFDHICKEAAEIIKNIVIKGIVDDRFVEGTDNFNKLPKINQELIKLVYDCMTFNETERPSCDAIIDRLMDIAQKNLPHNSFNEIEEYVSTLDDIKTETYGTIEFVEKAINMKFDSPSDSLPIIAEKYIPGYKKSTQEEFKQQIFKVFTQKV